MFVVCFQFSVVTTFLIAIGMIAAAYIYANKNVYMENLEHLLKEVESNYRPINNHFLTLLQTKVKVKTFKL